MTPQDKLATLGDVVKFECGYSGPLLWFFMPSPELPNMEPIGEGPVLEFVTKESHNGFIFCYGAAPETQKMILSRAFLELIGED